MTGIKVSQLQKLSSLNYNDSNTLILAVQSNPYNSVAFSVNTLSLAVSNVINTFGQSAYNQANSATILAQAAYNTANLALTTTTDQLARNVANSAAANTVYTQGVDNTQNTNIQVVGNNLTSNVAYFQGVSNTQNTTSSALSVSISQANTFLQSNDTITLTSAISYTDSANAWLQSNIALVLPQAKSYTDTANTFLQSNDTITLTAAKSYTDTANTFLRSNDTVTLTTAKSYTDSVGASKVNRSGDTITGTLNVSNTGNVALSVTGSVNVSQDLNVTGNIYVSGSTTRINANTLTVNDAMIYLASNNTGNLVDIGLVGSITKSPTGYQHTGIVRDHNDGKWKLFSNVTVEPSNTVNFTTTTVYDTLKVGNIETATANINGVDYATTLTSISTIQSSNTAYFQGVDNTQNTNITAVNTALSSNTVYFQNILNTQNTNITTANNLALSAFNLGNNSVQLTGSTVPGILGLTQTHNLMTQKSYATGVTTHDCSTGQYFWHIYISGNIIANLTNLNLGNSRQTEVNFLLTQSTLPYVVNQIEINGVMQTVFWENNITPTGNANKKDLMTFTIINYGGSYTILGKLRTFG